MFAMIGMLSIRLRSFLRRYAPTNILIGAIFTRRGLKWGMPAMLLAGPYLLAAVICVGWIERSGPGWLNLLVLLLLWNAIKFLVVGPVSLLWLVRVRVGEARVRRLARVPAISDTVALQERMTRSPARVLH
ncbi:sulfate permease [Microbacterium sp. NPDC058062]|uniref:sulfate permease n=1 Tax=Microbacterium sp. NPDC058062 TaxID=3346320 RepID=UPI0036DC3372